MNQFILNKSQEIAFVLLRISAYIRRFDLRKRIENLAYHLLENVHYENHELTLSTISTISGFINLGKSIYEIEPVNAKIILIELESLERAIKNVSGLDMLPDLKSVFVSKPEFKESDSGNQAKVVRPIKIRAIPESTFNNQVVKTTNRQGQIIEIIRKVENGKIQLKDIISSFPEVSERTIRYDLQRLCDEGKLTREGSGGPSNFYRLPDSISTSIGDTGGVMNQS